MMSMLCNCCVRELLILARTWFAFGLPSKTGCDSCSAAGFGAASASGARGAEGAAFPSVITTVGGPTSCTPGTGVCS
jgi:hypothetical protein